MTTPPPPPGPRGFSFYGRGREEQPESAQGVHAGQVIGDFRLVRSLGQGGMGQVWEAQQESLGRRVALKLVRPERVSEKTLALFSREARAGGRLQHPHLVSVHAHGVGEGIAWIAMELVEGAWTLRDFLDEAARTAEVPADYYRDVARFIEAVAEGMHAAHLEGVIHRDLKPQNILIDPQDRPKVTDFGLAKLIDEAALSETGDFAGTYWYASPEQVAGRRMGLDHRTDIFSLGVVLYELLAHRRPFEGDTTQQVVAQILTVDPPDLRALRSRTPRALAVITAKCLEKSPARRYRTMKDLAQDLSRFLRDEAILARPTGRLAKLGVWAQRNPTKTAVGLLTSIVLTMILTMVAREMAAQRNEAVSAQQIGLLSRFQASMLSGIEPHELGAKLREAVAIAAKGGEKVTGPQSATLGVALDRLDTTGIAVDLIDTALLKRAEEAIGEEFKEIPLIQGALLHELAEVFRRIGLHDRALAVQVKAIESRLPALGQDHPDSLTSRANMALDLDALGRSEEALVVIDSVIDIGRRARRTDPRSLSTYLSIRGRVLNSLARFEEALNSVQQAFSSGASALGSDDEDVLVWMNSVGYALIKNARYEEARVMLEQCLALRLTVHGPNHLRTLATHANLGLAFDYLGDAKRALEHQQAAYNGYFALLGAEHPTTVISQSNIASVLHLSGQYEEAVATYRQILQILQRQPGSEAQSASTMSNLGHSLSLMGRMKEAIQISASALDLKRTVYGSRHYETLLSLHNLADMLIESDRLSEAYPLAREAAQAAIETIPPENSFLQAVVRNIVLLEEQLGATTADEHHLEEAAIWRQRLEALEGAATSASPDSRN